MPWLYLVLNATATVYIQAAGAIAVGVVAAVGGYLVSRRQTSGSVSTSNAADLWEESRAIRLELRDTLADERAERIRLEERLAAETAERRRLEEQNRELLRRVAALEARMEGLDD